METGATDNRRVLQRLGLMLLIAGFGAGAAGLQGCGSSSTNGPFPATGGRSGGGVGGTSAGTGGSGGPGGSSGTGGRASGAGGSASGAGGSGTGGAAGCVVTIDRVSSPSWDNIEAGHGALLRVRGTVRGAKSSTVTWLWTVDYSGKTIPTSAVDAAGAVVEFPIEMPGSYQIVAKIAEDLTCPFHSQTFAAVPPAANTFVLRASVAGYPDKDITVPATQPTAEIRLDPGETAELSTTRAGSGAALPSYLRVSLPSSAFSVEGDTARGAFRPQLLPQLTYDLLIVPGDVEGFAPDLISGTVASWGKVVTLDAGIPVSATLRDAGARPVADALMVLRRGVLPSTVGVSDANGALSLRARAGTLAAFITPPASVGLPRISVGASGDAGILLDAAASSLELTMAWNTVVTAPLSVEVRTPDGATPMAGATVRARSQGQAVPVGTLTGRVNGGAPVSYPALGTTDIEIATGAAGVAVFPPLPIGSVELTVIPAPAAATAAPAAITTMPVTLTAAGLRQTITLSSKARLTGTLLPLADSPGTRVTAIDSSINAPGTVVSVVVAADGSYTLSVDPGRSYQLLAEPPPAATRGRAMLGSVTSAPGNTQVTAQTLPAVRVLGGVVMSAATGVVVPNVLVQAFCPAVSTKCYDPTFPLADAISRSNGTFELRLPEPAQN